MRFEVAALLAATSWAVGGLIAAQPSRVLGGPRFTRLRMIYVSVALVGIAWLVGGWRTVDGSDWLPLGASGFVGLAVGDAALFSAFGRLGPRRTGILFTANAPIAAAISAVVFGERFTVASGLGSALVLGGVVSAIAFGTRPGQSHVWEQVRGPLWSGVVLGLVGAAGQAVGVILADPVFDGTLNEWAGAAVRAVVGTAGLLLLVPFFERRRPVDVRRVALDARLWVLIIVSGTIGMVIGKTLVLVALTGGEPGIVSVLIATAPVIQLPLIWAVSRERPAAGAWWGALATAAGTALIVV